MTSELREKLLVFGQLLRPRPTLPPVQHAPGSRWLQSPQKVWLWIQERMGMTRTGTLPSVIPSGILTEPASHK